MSRVSQRGISLIERMVTFARLALLLGLAAPSFSEWLRNAHGLSLIEVLVVLVLHSIGLIGMVGLRGGDLVLVYQDRANCMVQELTRGSRAGPISCWPSVASAPTASSTASGSSTSAQPNPPGWCRWAAA